MTMTPEAESAAFARYPQANRERVRSWWSASPEPQVSVERKRAAARVVIEAAAAKAA